MPATAAWAAESDGYELVWADEFEIDGPPSDADWTYEYGFVRNQELQWYRPENAFCADGVLVIEARRESLENPGFRERSGDWREQRRTAEYTSALVTTRERHSWLYGRFEVRARIDTRDGLWPAIWFLGVEGDWPGNGEIDLMEYYRGDILANFAWGAPWSGGAAPTWRVARTGLADLDEPRWRDGFHVWRMDWTESKVELYVDDRLLNSIEISEAVNPDGTAPRYPFRQPQYLLLNLAVGSNGGDPGRTAFPARFEVDYVRVYQRH